MKKVLKIIVIIIGSLILFNILLIPFAMIGMKDIKSLSIVTPDLSQIEDGVYEGYYGKGRWQYHSTVSLKDSKIIKINIKNGKFPTPENLSKDIVSAIIKNQTIRLDAVSGASVNTKALCKSVEIALTSKQ